MVKAQINQEQARIKKKEQEEELQKLRVFQATKWHIIR